MKNRFAQPLYGKIIYIFETNLTMEAVPTIFDPSTYWIDVTGVDCEVGYIVEFKEGAGLVFVPPPSSELTEEEKLQQEAELVQGELRNMAISAMMMSLAGDKVDSTAYQSKLRSVSDNVALYMVDKFPSWNVGKSYVVDDRVVYNDVLYKVLTAHTSQESWKPDVSPSLFVKVIRQVGDEIPEWRDLLQTMHI